MKHHLFGVSATVNVGVSPTCRQSDSKVHALSSADRSGFLMIKNCHWIRFTVVNLMLK